MKQNVYLIGIGMGSLQGWTMQARQQLEKSEIVIGASRMLQGLDLQGKTVYCSYRPHEIGAFLRAQKNFTSAAVLLSGDVGFYSGAAGLVKELSDFTVTLLPGISSVVYFCSRLQTSWEDVCLASVHGRKTNLIQRICRHAKTFALLNGRKSLEELCRKLQWYHMSDVVLHIGERLSYLQERITTVKAGDVKELTVDELVVVLAENPHPQNRVCISLEDDAFIRGKVPMTKQAVRSAVLASLQLTADAVVYDIGAGTGSVSVEMALQSPDIIVYAIEKKEEAVALLQKNKQKFAADNITVRLGCAPEALDDLPVPTHAFIGGSSGELEEILRVLFAKNEQVRIVLTTVTLDSLAQVMQMVKQDTHLHAQVMQLQVAVDKMVAGYRMMQGQNPVSVITLWRA